MTPTQLFILSVLTLMGGVVLIGFSDQTEIGTVMIMTSIGGGVGAHVWAKNANQNQSPQDPK